jgi:hypothetical protein
MEKKFCEGEKPIPVGFLTKSNSSEQNIQLHVIQERLS